MVLLLQYSCPQIYGLSLIFKTEPTEPERLSAKQLASFLKKCQGSERQRLKNCYKLEESKKHDDLMQYGILNQRKRTGVEKLVTFR